jgi:hypothetical protein
MWRLQLADTIRISDARIEAVRVKYELQTSDFWQIPQNKQWVVKHAALEVVAAKAGIRFDTPQIVEANGGDGVAAVCVQGQMGDRFEWSIGEASPKNSRNSYPWAMAEKRSKDRVILKLTGIHGLVYSDNEVDAADGQVAPQPVAQLSAFRAKQLLKTDVLLSEIDNAKTDKRCDELAELFATELAFLPGKWIEQFRERIDQRRAELANGTGTKAEEANATLDRQFRETVG